MPKSNRKNDPAAKTPGPVKETRVEIKPAKGRPMLTWVGKKPLRQVTAYPAQLVERFDAAEKKYEPKPGIWKDWPKDIPQAGLLFYGDNKDMLAWLLTNGFRGRVKLIYIDPPFDSGANYIRSISLRGKSAPIEGEGYSLGEQIQYADIWANDNYLQFMYQRLLLLKSLLTDNGNIIVHCDYRKSHHLRLIMDEIFGESGFVNEIIWLAEGGGASGFRFSRKHQTLLYYSNTNIEEERLFNGNAVRIPYKTKNIQPQTYHYDANAKKRPGFKDGYTWLPNENGKIPTDAWLDCFLEESEGIPLDIWYDVKGLYGPSGELEKYPTQKPKSLLERVIKACSNEGDIICDCFMGSGTAMEVAQKLGRRWIGADINKGAIQTTVKRLEGVIQEQVENARQTTKSLPGVDVEETPQPAQTGFAVYRVNDYDLQIQHNEAFNLAVEHLGMTRTKTDTFFDGTLGKKLVKLVPFNHPITALDLEEVKDVLDTRPEEERNIVVTGLGKELAVDGWLEQWNQLRKKGNLPNQIEVIELRNDPKYGGFFTHEPSKSRVSFTRNDKTVEVAIEDFISPTILERLLQQNKDNPLFKPQIDDWRAMVDSVMIDSDYDGQVFNITLADVPERKNDLVEGKYTVEVKKGATVAVKITDMLGEEVLSIHKG